MVGIADGVWAAWRDAGSGALRLLLALPAVARALEGRGVAGRFELL